MAKSIPFFVVGALMGGGITWAVYSSSDALPPVSTTTVAPLSCDTKELESLRSKVVTLQAELQQQRNSSARLEPTHGELHPPAAERSDGSPDDDEKRVADEATRWRISAIEKFVPLSADQKSRLKTKYDAERSAKQTGEDASAESLEQILGTESAAYYREQVRASFERAKNEEVEREVVWLARKLALSERQEESVRRVLAEVEQGRNDISHDSPAGSPQERLRVMIEENRRKAEKRNELLQQILTPDQYQAYLASEADSAAADIEVFHDPGK